MTKLWMQETRVHTYVPWGMVNVLPTTITVCFLVHVFLREGREAKMKSLRAFKGR